MSLIKSQNDVLFNVLSCADIKDCSTYSSVPKIRLKDLYNPSDASLSDSDLARARELFTYNDKNEVIVFSDGACINNSFPTASAGIGVWFGYKNPLNLSEKLPGVQTHVHAEIYSAVRALQRFKLTGLTRINIHTDSKYVINCGTKWIAKWLKNGWKRKIRSKVRYKGRLIALHHLMNIMSSISWTHVRSHRGVVGNVQADILAKTGAYMK